MRSRNLSPQETRPAEPASSCPSQRTLTRCQTLRAKTSTSQSEGIKKTLEQISALALVNGQDLGVEVLGVAFLHHVLVDGEPGCEDAQLCGSGQAQLLQRRDKNTTGLPGLHTCTAMKQRLQMCFKTFWMLSSTRPPRTYTLSASTVSKAEPKQDKKSETT